MMTLYTWHVEININGEKWGDYKIIAPSDQAAAFAAGMKYRREEQEIYTGDIIYCSVTRAGDRV